MTLEDFEKELAESSARESKRKRSKSHDRDRERRHKHHSHHHHHKSSRHNDDSERSHQHKRSRRDGHSESDRQARAEKHRHHRRSRSTERQADEVSVGGTAPPTDKTRETRIAEGDSHGSQRDSWMKGPSQIEYVQRKRQASPQPKHVAATEKDFKLMVHKNELNQHLKDIDKAESGPQHKPKHTSGEVEYEFGDDGSSWRMTKLRGVYDEAKNSGRNLDDVAVERYGSLKAFDNAREEEIEVSRRERYGKEYVGKVKPSGDLYAERKIDNNMKDDGDDDDDDDDDDAKSEDEFEAVLQQKPAPATTVSLDQTALNKLKAQMMKAKLKGSPDAAQLEAEYNNALSGRANSKPSGGITLNRMEARQLAGGRDGEVKKIDNKRGRERGLVEENEDMSIEDMVRQERRTRGQMGGEGRAFAERIAKDAKFDADLDYMDENAAKLAKHVQKSEINLRSTAIGDYQKMKRILDTCPLCYHEDTNKPPQAPIVSLGTRTFLTLPTAPEITPYGMCASIVPIQHRLNLLECDDDEWEEIRNFMKTLARFYYSLTPKRAVIFYENAAHEGRKRHASLEAVPLPVALGDTAPAFFKEAILASDEEWTQHKKVIDTLHNATARGMGKLAFRRSMVSELPYFHVWFSIDGGLGHVVENTERWPKGDLFARGIIGGMLDVGPEVVNRQGRWRAGDPDMDARAKAFRKGWEKFDWTKALIDAE